MASIQFTDSTGTATLTNAHPSPASRFQDWRPVVVPNAEVAHEVGTKARHSFVFGDVYGAQFTLADIPNTEMAVMDRLARHLYYGGEVTVNTDDAAARTYTCTIAPEAGIPVPELSDPVLLWYSVSFDVINTEAAPLLCIYP